MQVSLHTLVLLGDVVEMWLAPMTLSPLTLPERVAKWKSNISCKVFFDVVRKMAEEDGVKVFYIRGNHDHEMTAEAVEELMGKKVEFIEGTLIYVINSDDGQQYRIRFAHGHDWDLFNTYSLTDANDPLGGRPIGYYVTRAVATTETVITETEEVRVHALLFHFTQFVLHNSIWSRKSINKKKNIRNTEKNWCIFWSLDDFRNQTPSFS